MEVLRGGVQRARHGDEGVSGERGAVASPPRDRFLQSGRADLEARRASFDTSHGARRRAPPLRLLRVAYGPQLVALFRVRDLCTNQPVSRVHRDNLIYALSRTSKPEMLKAVNASFRRGRPPFLLASS